MPQLVVHAAGGPETYFAHRMVGKERLSELFTYEIDVETTKDGLAREELRGMLGRRAEVQYSLDGVRSGILSNIEMLTVRAGDPTVYRFTLSPTLFRTTLSRSHRVYPNARVPAIVAAVLRRHEKELHEQFKIEVVLERWSDRISYTAQHDETDFVFMSRIMERWGLFYFFEEGDHGDVLVISDQSDKLMQLDTPVNYVDSSDGIKLENVEAISELSARHRLTTNAVSLTDYNWRNQGETAHLHGRSPEALDGYGEHHLYGRDARSSTLANRLAHVAAGSQRAQSETYVGRTPSRQILPGRIFNLIDHPLPGLCQKYLVVGVEHEELGRHGETSAYEKRFEAIPMTVPFFAEQRAAWPSVAGLTHGFVVGDATGAAAPIDDDGCYRIRMPYDGLDAQKSVRPVRRAQPSAGADHGTHFPLHIGTEVAIAYIDGDPDRPIIVGALHNADSKNPVTGKMPTQGALRSRGGVEIRFDDDLSSS